ncbi:MAG: esterase/lipase family protein [Alphaproteobacteria bacterium]
MNFAIPTLGGRQLWTDIRILGGWRVQRHVWTRRCRLLDPRDCRLQSGDQQAVLDGFEEKIRDGRIKGAGPKAVVLIHGLGRSAHSFDVMAGIFRAEGREVVGFNYASTREEIEIHAAHLNAMMNELRGVDHVDFVVHSLGGIVLRQALNDTAPWRDRMQLGRAVMLGTPNQGSKVAEILSGYAVMNALYGPALRQLANTGLGRKFPMPMAFATIAGSVNKLPFLSGVNDGFVSDAEAQLDGAAGHLTVEAAHTFMMNDRQAVAFTREFLAAA